VFALSHAWQMSPKPSSPVADDPSSSDIDRLRGADPACAGEDEGSGLAVLARGGAEPLAQFSNDASPALPAGLRLSTRASQGALCAFAR
jgi:hypothetical protein